MSAVSNERPLSGGERAILLAPCECGHTINDHGGLVECWACSDENRECDRNFEALLVERVGVIVTARTEATAAPQSPQDARERPGRHAADSGGSGLRSEREGGK